MDAHTSVGLGVLVARAREELLALHGEGERARVEGGVRRVAERWQAGDGDADEFTRFCVGHYLPQGQALEGLLDRFERVLDVMGGHLHEIRRHLRIWADLPASESKALHPYDSLFARLDPASDYIEQMHKQRLAFAILLNFEPPGPSLIASETSGWSSSRWAALRVAGAIGPRIPAELTDETRHVYEKARKFVAEFHIPVGALVDSEGQRWMEPEKRLLAHWLLREEIRSCYGEPSGLARQRALLAVMGRAIDGTIPSEIMAGRATGDWDAVANTLGGRLPEGFAGPQRYETLIKHFHLARKIDAYHPDHPTAIARKFGLEREMGEEQVESLLVELLESPVRRRLAGILRDRLGRPLEAHDIYFEQVGDDMDGTELDARVNERFSDEDTFEHALPAILRGLGFSEKDAVFFGARIRVEIARGAGHAVRPGRPEYGAWLRTNRQPSGLGWAGFSTAMHELGHNLEQLISTHFVPRAALRGVPNTACTEAFAFLYQSQGRKVLGIEEGATLGRHAASTMLAACQIAGPSLVELYTWRWLYANPGADAAALRDEMLRIADHLWRRYYEEDFGTDRNHILAAYQHMIAYPLYLPDYPLGHVISFQIHAHMEGRDLAAETLRICSTGRVSPDAWMRAAVGGPVSAAPMIEAAGSFSS